MHCLAAANTTSNPMMRCLYEHGMDMRTGDHKSLPLSCKYSSTDSLLLLFLVHLFTQAGRCISTVSLSVARYRSLPGNTKQEGRIDTTTCCHQPLCAYLRLYELGILRRCLASLCRYKYINPPTCFSPTVQNVCVC